MPIPEERHGNPGVMEGMEVENDVIMSVTTAGITMGATASDD